jgi:hypothetical protein
MTSDTRQESVVRTFSRRKRLARIGLWLIITEVLVLLAIHQFDAGLSNFWLIVFLVLPALLYLFLMWRFFRCPACGASVMTDAGPYQRVVFTLDAKRCPRCRIPLA